MCGICGVLGERVDNKVVRGMLDKIKHRGPDDEGVYQTDALFLGHRRLSIIDTTDAGHQPMLLDDLVLIFNGEIYNYKELRGILQGKGHCFQTDTDTEVILHSYKEWGKECFSRFRGMWALAIFDTSRQEVVLSRDRFGIKPLYYVEYKRSFVFASEIDALFVAGVKPEPNIDRVVAYLMARPDILDTEKDTFFAGVSQLPGGTYLIVDMTNCTRTLNRYYDLFLAVDAADDSNFEETYYEVVKQHLRSDVRVGTCLSGGLDSSTLAAVAKSEYDKLGRGNLAAVTAKSEDTSNDESNYAQMVAENSKLEWHIAYPTFKDFVKYHKELLTAQGEPVGGPSIFMQYWVMKKAHEVGIKVMLDGQGGDETLLGYERYYVSYLSFILRNKGLARFFLEYKMIVKNSKFSFVQLLKYVVCLSYSGLHERYLAYSTKWIKSDLQKKFFCKYKHLLRLEKDIKKMQIKEILLTNLPALLHYEDKNSMYYSIEARVPYLDHILVEKAIKMDLQKKICSGWSKYSLRKISEKFLPFDVTWRKNKFGFESPDSIWLKQYLDEMQKMVDKSNLLKEILVEIPDLKMLSKRHQWRLYNLAVWDKQYWG